MTLPARVKLAAARVARGPSSPSARAERGCRDSAPNDGGASTRVGRLPNCRTDRTGPGDPGHDFADYERRALARLHDQGWSGDGAAIVVRDEFNADGSPSHGEGVPAVARHYAPNVKRLMGASPAEAVPAVPHNEFVYLLSVAFDFTEVRHTETSYAAPRVSGALAILKQKCPDLSYRHLSFILPRSARDLGGPGVDEVYGHGLLDLEQPFAQAESLGAMFEDYDSTIPAITP